MKDQKTTPFHVVTVGGGFGGLYAAKGLSRSNVQVTLIDKRNFHLFQPLLYQVAAGELSPGDIASPLRSIFHRSKNITVMMDEVTDLDPAKHEITLKKGHLHYDALVVATGANPFYFGNDHWARYALGIKTVEDAVAIRHRILQSFELAEVESDPQKRKELLTFAIIGGGPTGVELAGAIGELARTTLKDDFRNINPSDAAILLIETGERILSTFKADLSIKAEKALSKLGVTIMSHAKVTDITGNSVKLSTGDNQTEIKCKNILWTAGVKASAFGQILATKCNLQLDRSGRVPVEKDLRVAKYPDIWVIGDQAGVKDLNDKPLPGLATVAMQQGTYVAKLLIKLAMKKKTSPDFRYHNQGSLAVIGRNAAVAEMGKLRLNGWIAWYIWTLIHIRYLIGFDNKILVLFHWAWNYMTNRRNARLITGEDQLQ